MIEPSIRLGRLQSQRLGNPHGNVVANAVELGDDVLLDLDRLDVGGLEADGVDEELLFGLGEGVVEEARLGPVVVKRGREGPDEVACGGAAGGGEEAAALVLGGLLGEALVEGVGGVLKEVLVLVMVRWDGI